MKILITGAGGFIAWHLINALKNDHELIGIDNFNSNYYDSKLKYDRWDANKDFIDMKYHDLGLGIPTLEKVDLIIHLGAFAAVRASMENPLQCIQDNIIGTQNIISYAEKYDIPVLYASTSCVSAGNPLPWKEDQLTSWQLNPYGYTKHTNECQFKSSKITKKIGLRFFTAYGEWGRPDMALHIFTKNMIENKPITVYNYGDMKRDFTYVGDIIQGIKILLNEFEKYDEINELYNIGYGTQVPLMTFVNVLEVKLGKKAVLDLKPKHPADTQETWSNTEKLQALGYKPTTSIEEGMDKFIFWFKNYYGV